MTKKSNITEESVTCVSRSRAAELLGVSLRTISQRVTAGEIPTVRVGQRRRVIRLSDLHKYLAGRVKASR